MWWVKPSIKYALNKYYALNRELRLTTRAYGNLSRLCYQLLTPWNLQSALTERDRRSLQVTPFQSKRLTVTLGIARWQTVVLLLSTLRIIVATANFSSWLPVFVTIVLLVVAPIFVAVHG